jgi:hypothetical protein
MNIFREFSHKSQSDQNYHATVIPLDKDGEVVRVDPRQSIAGKVHVPMDKDAPDKTQ